MKLVISLIIALVISGCAIQQKTNQLFNNQQHTPKIAENTLQKEFDKIPPPAGRKVSVAVYQFVDKTGQRKPQPGVASFSTAVTQGAEVFLIKALQDVGQGQWFDVVERTNIDALTKERLIIRQMREAYEGKDAKPLMPMQFAGIIMEGGIIGYDSGSESGGAAYRFLGIGPSTQYSKDTVTVSLRAISVNTGKVLAAVHVTKIVYSTADSVAVLKFLNQNTQAFEAETGLTINEPGTLAVKATVEAAVVELIKEGEKKGVWDFKTPPPPVVVIPTIVEPVKVAAADPKEISKNPINPVAVVRGPPPLPIPVVQQPVTDKVYLSELSYIYKEKDLKSQKTWQFVAGTELSVHAQEGDWVQIKDNQNRGGWVQRTALTAKK
jgi:curli production assembly/transport component CsgG